MNKDHRNFYGLSLIEAEKIEAKLHSKISSKDVFGLGAKETLIITNKRIIKVKLVRDMHETGMIGIGDIEGISLRSNRKNFLTLLWGFLGIIGGVALYYVLQSSFNSTVVSVFIGLLSIVLGLVLVIDFIASKEEKVLTISAGSFKLKVNIPNNQSKNIERFVNKIFEIKMKTTDENINPLSWPRF